MKTPIPLENKQGEPVVENFILEALHEILESEDLDQALKESDQRPTPLFSAHISDEAPPNFDMLVKGEQVIDDDLIH